eukprot:240594_1
MDMLCVCVLLLVSFITVDCSYIPPHDYNGWTEGESSLPRKCEDGAVGYDETNDTIWILGGYDGNHRQLVGYQRGANYFIDKGQMYFDEKLGGWAQYYTQLGPYLYIAGRYFIYKFNVRDQSMEYEYYERLDRSIGGGCICSLNVDGGYLIISGGSRATEGDSLPIVQIMNISANKWISNVPSLNTGRRSHSCISFNDTKIFVIGGEVRYVFTDTVEVFNFYDDDTWSYTADNLSSKLIGARTVLYKNDIVVIGGYSRDGPPGGPFRNNYLDSIHVINGITNTIYPVRSFLDQKIAYGASIIVQSVIYSFGGNDGFYMDSWRWIEPNTFSPSMSPSQPTMYPTSTPIQSQTSHDSHQTVVGLLIFVIVHYVLLN